MQQLKDLFNTVLDKGYVKLDRTGVGTKSVFGYMSRFNLNDGFPIVTLKKTFFRSAAVELLWMIGGWRNKPEYKDKNFSRTNIRYLLDNDVHIWTDWPYKAYCQTIDDWYKDHEVRHPLPDSWFFKDEEKSTSNSITLLKLTQKQFEQRICEDDKFAHKFGELGPVYQKQWRDFQGKYDSVDQLMEMINKLKNKPDDRRNLTSFWNPTELHEMMLAPCHMFHQVWTRELTFEEKIQWVMRYTDVEMENLYITEAAAALSKRALSLQMYQRSSDCFLGVPFDWVFYALLTHMLAEVTNMVVDEFIWVSGDTHLYTNQWDAAKEILTREPHPLPKLKIKHRDNIEDFVLEDFELINYKFHPAIKVAVAV